MIDPTGLDGIKNPVPVAPADFPFALAPRRNVFVLIGPAFEPVDELTDPHANPQDIIDYFNKVQGIPRENIFQWKNMNDLLVILTFLRNEIEKEGLDSAYFMISSHTRPGMLFTGKSTARGGTGYRPTGIVQDARANYEDLLKALKAIYKTMPKPKGGVFFEGCNSSKYLGGNTKLVDQQQSDTFYRLGKEALPVTLVGTEGFTFVGKVKDKPGYIIEKGGGFIYYP